MAAASNRPTAVNTSGTRATVVSMRDGRCAFLRVRCAASMRRRRCAKPPSHSSATAVTAAGYAQVGGTRLLWGVLVRARRRRWRASTSQLVLRPQGGHRVRRGAAAGGSVARLCHLTLWSSPDCAVHLRRHRLLAARGQHCRPLACRALAHHPRCPGRHLPTRPCARQLRCLQHRPLPSLRSAQVAAQIAI